MNHLTIHIGDFQNGGLQLMDKMPVETYSRIVGYFRPIQNWNKGEKQEFKNRKKYNIDKLKSEVKK